MARGSLTDALYVQKQHVQLAAEEEDDDDEESPEDVAVVTVDPKQAEQVPDQIYVKIIFPFLFCFRYNLCSSNIYYYLVL